MPTYVLYDSDYPPEEGQPVDVNDPYGNHPAVTTRPVSTWLQEDRNKLGAIVTTLAVLVLVAVLSLITQVIGVSGGKKEADETQRLLRDVQQAITANPGNPAPPMSEEPKK